MSRIQRSGSSEVFDIYAKKMYQLNKQASNPLMEGVIQVLRAGGESIEEVAKRLGQNSDQVIKFIMESGLITAEELASITGKNVNDINKIIGVGGDVAREVVPAAAKVIPEVIETGVKMTPDVIRITSEVKASARVIVDEAGKISKIMSGMKSLAGKSAEDVALMFRQLELSRRSLRSAATKAKNLAASASEEARVALAEVINLKQLLSAAEAYGKQADEAILILKKTIADMGGQLDEAGKLIKGLKEDVAKAGDELASTTEALQKLTAEGIELAAKQEDTLKMATAAAYQRGFIEGALEAVEEAGKAGTFASKAAAESAETLGKTSAKASKSVVDEVPEAAETAVEATTSAAAAGKAAGKDSAKKATKKATEEGATESVGKKPFWQALLLKYLGPTFSGIKSMSWTGLTLAYGGAGMAGTAALSVAGALSFPIILGILGVGSYYAWKRWYQDNFSLAKEKILEIKTSQNNAITRLQALKFNAGSQGLQRTENLIVSLKTSFKSLGALTEDISQEDFFKAFADLERMKLLLVDYLGSKDIIARDLMIQNGWPEAIAALDDLAEKTNDFREVLMTAMESADQLPKETERGIETPVGSPSRNIEQAPSAEQDPVKKDLTQMAQPLKIYDEIVDIGHLGRGMRSAAPRMVKKILTTPEGLAFTDPENKWGGWLPKTGDKGSDYLRALKYLYLNKIFNRTDLRKYVRQNMSRDSRRRMSGWRSAVKYYRNRLGKYANQENNEFFTQKFVKPANSNESGVDNDKGIITDMRKNADQISKQYFQDAVSGLADQYAKSYYAGLKSMHDQKLGKTEADFVKLYEVHNESGADLIGTAHPKTIDIADAMGNGGVVENQIEQHRHNKGVAQSMPSGNFRGRHAWVIQNLVKLADQADEDNMKEASDLIDKALEELGSI